MLGPIVGRNSAQPASRYALTAALADRHTVDITGYPLGVDRAVYDGHLRSDKAPGQPVLAVPFYAAARAVGAEAATYKRVTGNLGLWFVTFGTSVLPFAVLLVLMYRSCRRSAREHALAAALAVGFGGMLLSYTVHLFGHVLGATLAFGAWYVLESDPGDRRRLAGAGALLGAAVCVEYHAAIVAVALTIYVLARARRRVGWLMLGAAPFAAALGWYQWRAFGAPWRLPFGYFAGTIEGTTGGGYKTPNSLLGVKIPGLHGFAVVLTGPHGLLQNAPLVILAIGAALSVAWSGTGAIRRNSLLALATSFPCSCSSPDGQASRRWRRRGRAISRPRSRSSRW